MHAAAPAYQFVQGQSQREHIASRQVAQVVVQALAGQVPRIALLDVIRGGHAAHLAQVRQLVHGHLLGPDATAGQPLEATLRRGVGRVGEQDVGRLDVHVCHAAGVHVPQRLRYVVQHHHQLPLATGREVATSRPSGGPGIAAPVGRIHIRVRACAGVSLLLLLVVCGGGGGGGGVGGGALHGCAGGRPVFATEAAPGQVCEAPFTQLQLHHGVNNTHPHIHRHRQTQTQSSQRPPHDRQRQKMGCDAPCDPSHLHVLLPLLFPRREVADDERTPRQRRECQHLLALPLLRHAATDAVLGHLHRVLAAVHAAHTPEDAAEGAVAQLSRLFKIHDIPAAQAPRTQAHATVNAWESNGGHTSHGDRHTATQPQQHTPGHVTAVRQSHATAALPWRHQPRAERVIHALRRHDNAMPLATMAPALAPVPLRFAMG